MYPNIRIDTVNTKIIKRSLFISGNTSYVPTNLSCWRTIFVLIQVCPSYHPDSSYVIVAFMSLLYIYSQARYSLKIHILQIPIALIITSKKEVILCFCHSWLFVTITDEKITKHTNTITKVLVNGNDSFAVHEKVKEFFKSLYSLKGL